MEQTFSGDIPTTEERIKRHLTLEEQLAQLEAKDKKAKETEARRKAKIAKLRSVLLLQKRETFDKVLSEHGIHTESQLQGVNGTSETHFAMVSKFIKMMGVQNSEDSDVPKRHENA